VIPPWLVFTSRSWTRRGSTVSSGTKIQQPPWARELWGWFSRLFSIQLCASQMILVTTRPWRFLKVPPRHPLRIAQNGRAQSAGKAFPATSMLAGVALVPTRNATHTERNEGGSNPQVSWPGSLSLGYKSLPHTHAYYPSTQDKHEACGHLGCCFCCRGSHRLTNSLGLPGSWHRAR
jgi:hypothetical protein